MVFMPRDIAKDILTSKFDVPHMMIVDSKDESTIDDLTGTQMSFMKKAPLLWDFIINLLSSGVTSNTVEDYSKDFYRILYPAGRCISDYLSDISGVTEKKYVRENLFRNLFGSGTPIVYTGAGGGKRFGQPFRASLVSPVEYGFAPEHDTVLELLLEKTVFENYVEKEFAKTNGFINIPRRLFPLSCMKSDKKNPLIVSNPHYRLQVLGFSKKGGGLSSKVSKETFIKAVVPEHYRIVKGMPRQKKLNPLATRNRNINQYNYFKDNINHTRDSVKLSGYKGSVIKSFFIESDAVIFFYEKAEKS